jgi:molecular chaperone DnaK (HSP70)
VRQLLAQFFGREPNDRIDPDQAVAVGVAVQGVAQRRADIF